MNIIVEIAIDCPEWEKYQFSDVDFFTKITKNLLSKYPNFQKTKAIELSILLTDNAKMKSLNSEFRAKDKTTNVLSFPDNDINWRKIVEFLPDPDYIYLGDIAFGYLVIKEEAAAKEISFQDHLTHLTIHSILHLLGYDHIEKEDAEAMEAVEIELLSKIGIASPYK